MKQTGPENITPVGILPVQRHNSARHDFWNLVGNELWGKKIEEGIAEKNEEADLVATIVDSWKTKGMGWPRTLRRKKCTSHK
jgi:hypothetical protein